MELALKLLGYWLLASLLCTPLACLFFRINPKEDEIEVQSKEIA